MSATLESEREAFFLFPGVACRSSLSRRERSWLRRDALAEQEVFGMHLSDVEALRKVFDAIDLDKSGTIETTELREALEKAGKKPTDEQVRRLLFGSLPAQSEAQAGLPRPVPHPTPATPSRSGQDCSGKVCENERGQVRDACRCTLYPASSELQTGDGWGRSLSLCSRAPRLARLAACRLRSSKR